MLNGNQSQLHCSAIRSLLGVKSVPPFAALRAFEAVGREGGIRKAALALGIDHAVVSRHIRQLEAWLQTPLFSRAGSQLALTEEGGRYHTRVTGALVEIASATSDLLQRGDHSKVNVSCVPGLAIQWVAPRFALFEKLRPEYEVELRPTDQCSDLLMHEADVDIRFYGDYWDPKPGGKALRYIELARPPVMAVASPEVAAQLADVTIEELARQQLLHEEHHEQWRAWLLLNGVELDHELRGPLLWHAHHALAAAKLGRGVALASRYLVNEDLERGELVELRIPKAEPKVIGSYCFVARAGSWTKAPIQQLRRFLQAQATY